METTRETKTSLYRASSDDAFRERVCSSFFLLCVQAYVTIHSFLVFFLRASLTQRGQNKGKRDLFLSFSYSYIYTQQKSSRVFFFLSRAISLTASLRQATHGVRKQEKKGIDFTYDLINVAKIPMWMKKNNSDIKNWAKTNEMMMHSWNVQCPEYVNEIIDTRNVYTFFEL